MKKYFLYLFMVCTGYVYGQLDVSSTGTPFVIDFTGFDGSGFDPAPAAGQLDSDTWEVLGFSDGDCNFGDTQTSGDFAKGTTTGNITSGGVYAFDNGGNAALYVQPTSSDFNPGSFTLRLQNNTGSTVTELDLSYLVYVFNNEGRANSFNLSFSYDNATFIDVPSLDLTSAEADEDSLYTYNQSENISGLTIGAGDFFYLKWEGSDVSGGGSRDEFGLDDISITAAAGVVIPSVDFTSNSLDVNEGAGVATVNVEITEAGDCDAYISLIDTLGTATLGSDFTVADPVVVSFTALGSTTQSYNITIASDVELELDETLVMKIDSVVGTCNVGVVDQITVTILDDETAEVGDCANLYFSEYIEGSGNNKALEIYNPTGATVDLDGYFVKVFNNGGTTPSNTLEMTGSLGAGDVYLIVNSSADSALLDLADTTSSVTFFNGDDAVVLFQFSDTIDVVGRVGEDPGSEWVVDTAGTGENTLVRKAAITSGQTDWTVGATEWDTYPQNEFSFFGSHTTVGCDVGCVPPDDAAVQAAVPIGMKIGWTAVPGATKYGVQYRVAGTGPWSLKKTSTNNAKIPGLTGGETYEFRVASRCGTELSAFSAIDSVTLPTKQGQFNELDVQVYPNPSNGQVFISGFDIDNGEVSIQVMDLTGRMLFETVSMNEGNTIVLDLPESVSGTVIMNIVKGESVHRQVLVVQ